VVALVGPNGAGKSTLLKTVFGLLTAWEGRVLFHGAEIQNNRPTTNIRAGLSYVPQGNRAFDDLSVVENLQVGGHALGDKRLTIQRIEGVFQVFPVLRERQRQNAGKLSGGEKQMLALGRASMLRPTLLLVDEPSLGLAPQAARDALDVLGRLNDEFGTTLLIVEQNVKEALRIAQRGYVMRLGRVVLEGSSGELQKGEMLRQAFLA
jgi:branched-chain amino acid transport system ATP-binding protein